MILRLPSSLGDLIDHVNFSIITNFVRVKLWIRIFQWSTMLVNSAHRSAVKLEMEKATPKGEYFTYLLT